MNWAFLITAILILGGWVGLALLFQKLGFMKEEREILKEGNRLKSQNFINGKSSSKQS